MWNIKLEPCLHLGKELVCPWRSSSQLCLDGPHPVLSRSLGKACCFILQTTWLRGCLSLMTICPERLLSWALGSLASGWVVAWR